MSTSDDDRDAELTTDWPGTQRGPAADDGEATTVVPKTSRPTPQQSAPPPMSLPPRPAPTPPPPPMSPPQAGQRDPRWQPAPGPGGARAPQFPPGPNPSGAYSPVAPKPPKRSRWVLLAIGALALVVIAVAVTVFVTRSGDSSTATARSSTSPASNSTTSASTSSTAAAPSTGTSATTSADIVAPTALKGLLASVADVTQLADNAMMTPTPVQDAPLTGATITPDSCTGAVMPGFDSVYRSSNFTGIAVQGLSNKPQRVDVIQSIASFPSAAEAQSFVDRQFADWQACKYTDITLTVGNGDPQRGRVAISANTLGTNNVFIFPPSDDPDASTARPCEHAMSARENLVVDVRSCAPSVGSMGWTLARDIGEKITGQR